MRKYMIISFIQILLLLALVAWILVLTYGTLETSHRVTQLQERVTLLKEREHTSTLLDNELILAMSNHVELVQRAVSLSDGRLTGMYLGYTLEEVMDWSNDDLMKLHADLREAEEDRHLMQTIAGIERDDDGRVILPERYEWILSWNATNPDSPY